MSLCLRCYMASQVSFPALFRLLLSLGVFSLPFFPRSPIQRWGFVWSCLWRWLAAQRRWYRSRTDLCPQVKNTNEIRAVVWNHPLRLFQIEKTSLSSLEKFRRLICRHKPHVPKVHWVLGTGHVEYWMLIAESYIWYCSCLKLDLSPFLDGQGFWGDHVQTVPCLSSSSESVFALAEFLLAAQSGVPGHIRGPASDAV